MLPPENAETYLAKHYRPITCLCIIFKFYTSYRSIILCDHCEMNNITTSEQGKNKSWGLLSSCKLLNKTVRKEERSKGRNFYTFWLGYRRTFDTVPHDWLLHAFKLAKTPEKLLVTIRELTKLWSTKLHLSGTKKSITTKIMRFHKGTLKGEIKATFIHSLLPTFF